MSNSESSFPSAKVSDLILKELKALHPIKEGMHWKEANFHLRNDGFHLTGKVIEYNIEDGMYDESLVSVSGIHDIGLISKLLAPTLNDKDLPDDLCLVLNSIAIKAYENDPVTVRVNYTLTEK